MGAEDDQEAILTSLTGPLSFAATEPYVTTQKIEYNNTKALVDEFTDIDVQQNERVTGWRAINDGVQKHWERMSGLHCP